MQHLEQLLKTVSRIALCQLSQQMDHRFRERCPGPGIANGAADSKAAGGKFGRAEGDTIASKGAKNVVGK